MTSSNSAFQPILPCTVHRVVASMFVRDLALCHYHQATVAKRRLGLRRLSSRLSKMQGDSSRGWSMCATRDANIEYPDALTWPGYQNAHMDR